MTDSCSKCCEVKRECRCTVCCQCEGDLAAGDCSQMKIMFKKKKLHCRKCGVSLCGKCLVNTLCNLCHKEQEAYKELWHDIDISLSLSPKEKDVDNALEDMIDTIRDNSLSTLQNLLDHCGKSFLDKFDSDGQTLLHHAVRAANVESVQYLLDCGATVNVVDNEGCSPLHLLAAGQRTPNQGQIFDMLVSGGINPFLLNAQQETALAISLATDNFELQSLLEPIMFRDSSNIIVRYLNSKPDLPDDVFACLRYIISKIKCLNPFEKKESYKLGRNKSLNYRSMKEKGPLISEGCDPYKLKKTVADNNDKITKLKDEISGLREELARNSETHRTAIERLEVLLDDEREKREQGSHQIQEYHHNTVSILEQDLQEAKRLEEDAVQALKDAVKLNKRYKLCWVPKSVTRKCADTSCPKVFRDGHSAHHCRCCGRVFCYQCSIKRLKVPVYGYEQPVRVCNYCYNLLNEEVLCDFDENDLDIDQWNSVHYQNKSNTDNMGRKSIFNFQRQRSLTATSATSGYVSKSGGFNSERDESACSVYSSEMSSSAASSPSSVMSSVLSSIVGESADDQENLHVLMTGSASSLLPSQSEDIMTSQSEITMTENSEVTMTTNTRNTDTDERRPRLPSSIGYSDTSSVAAYSDSESTLSNHSNPEEEDKPRDKKSSNSRAANQWKQFQRMLSLKNNNTFNRRGSSKL